MFAPESARPLRGTGSGGETLEGIIWHRRSPSQTCAPTGEAQSRIVPVSHAAVGPRRARSGQSHQTARRIDELHLSELIPTWAGRRISDLHLAFVGRNLFRHGRDSTQKRRNKFRPTGSLNAAPLAIPWGCGLMQLPCVRASDRLPDHRCTTICRVQERNGCFRTVRRHAPDLYRAACV